MSVSEMHLSDRNMFVPSFSTLLWRDCVSVDCWFLVAVRDSGGKDLVHSLVFEDCVLRTVLLAFICPILISSSGVQYFWMNSSVNPGHDAKCPLLIAVTYVEMAGLKVHARRYFASCCLVVLLLMILMLFFFSSLAGRFPDCVALLPGCILISSTFDQAFCSSLFDFLPRLSWGFTSGFVVVVGCMSARSPADFFRGCMRPWRCPSGLVVIVGVPCGHGGRR